MLFLIVYAPMVFFMSLFYINPHHVGIITIVFIYCFWCLVSEKENYQFPNIFKITVLFIILVQIYWSLFSVFNDIKNDYGEGREISKFIKEYHLTDYRIMCKTGNSNPDFSWVGTSINPYFNKNIFYNYNTSYPDKLYIFHKKGSKKTAKKVYKKWEKIGPPEVVVTNNSYSKIKLKYFPKMYPVKCFYNTGFVFKNIHSKAKYCIYVTKSIQNKIEGKSNE